MAKRKRPQNHALTQEEIWDDSALIRSWDEAVAEYVFYHSIAARGEDVEDVLRQVERDEARGLDGFESAKRMMVAVGEELEEGEVEGGEDGEVVEDGGEGEEGAGAGGGGPASAAVKARLIGPQLPGAATGGGGKAGPEVQHDPGKVAADAPSETAGGTRPGQDPALENMKMAYWWAGYYSGLYEGQQQAKSAGAR